MSRPRAGYIGFNRVPAASAPNSAASGVWSLREAEAMRRAGTWPTAGNVVTAITGLELWLDASDASTLYDATTGGSLVAADGGVARWEDKSGNGRHATQATSGSRPARKTAIQNSLAVLRFDGSDDRMSLSSAITIPPSFTCFSVLQRPSSGATKTMPFGHGDSAPASGAYPGGYWVFDITYHRSHTDPDYFTTHGTTDTRTGYFVMETNRTANTSVDLKINGVSKGTVTTGDGITQTATGSIDSIGYKNDPTYHQGDICEIIIYNSALSDTDRAAVQSYLMTKWGIS
jgi:hypothetical protein